MNIKENFGWLFVLPFLIVFAVFQVYPIFYTLYLSFTEFASTKEPVFIGIENYLNLVQDIDFWGAFLNTWLIWIPNIVSQIALALALAVWMTNFNLRIKGVGFFRAVFFFPNLVTAASIALLFNVLLDWQSGMVNQLVYGTTELGKEQYVNWMEDPLRARIILSGIQTWMWFGNTLIILMAGLLGIPRTYYEAAEVDGAPAWTVFWKITMPLLRPIMIFTVITSLIGGMQMFDLPFVITNGSGEPERALVTNVMYMYNTGFVYDRLGYASAISYLLFVLVIIFSLIYFRIERRKSLGEGV